MKGQSSAYKEFQNYMKSLKGRNFIQGKDEDIIKSIVHSQSSITSDISVKNRWTVKWKS